MKLSSAVGFASASVVLLSSLPTAAQIIPDNTLGNENSVVVPNVEINGINRDRIDGGAIRDANLFHSFQEFNINDGQGAYFSNPEGIINILSRVTGNNLSNILGTLGVLGNANLFLINPNGIVFGPNARLDVGGSFFATSADSILFDNFEFSVSNPAAPPLLTINIPIGLNFRENPGNIVNRSVAVDSEDNSVGLQVLSQKTLGLIGGDLQIEGGILTASQGRIELGSVAGNSSVSLNPIDTGYALGYENVQNFQDIALSQEAFIDVRGEGGGDVQIQARQLSLDSSTIEASTQGSGQGGVVSIQASESVEVVGGNESNGIYADVDSDATGEGGDLTINTQRLLVQNGFRISASIYGNGDGGNLTVTATDIELIGIGAGNGLTSAITASIEPGGVGEGGDLTIYTQNLSVREGAQILAFTKGNGNTGNLTITATDIELIGTSTDGKLNSNLTTSVEEGGVGEGGDLTINTQNLSVREGAQILAFTNGNGDAGNLTIRASNIELIGRSADDKFPSAMTTEVQKEGVGEGGDLTINTQNLSVREGAQILAFTRGDGNGGNLIINTQNLSVQDSRSTINAETFSSGAGGSVNITAAEVVIQDSANINVSSEEAVETDAGNIEINAPVILLNNNASIEANTSGGQGNIFLNTNDLRLRRNSSITTNATGTAPGGNITINTDFLIGLENSDITANAQQASGGQIIINASDGLFGIRAGLQATEASDITATSELGVDFSGVVELNSSIDTTQSLTEFDSDVVDPSALIAQNPCQQAENSEFIITGRGGLPPNPTQEITPFNTQVNLSDTVTETHSTSRSTQPFARQTTNQSLSSLDIVPARGWIRNENGDVILVDYDPTQTALPRSRSSPQTCHPNLSREGNHHE